MPSAAEVSESVYMRERVKCIYYNTYMQLLLLAVVRLAKARVDASLTSPLSELTILIKGCIPSEIKTGHINW